MGNAAIQCSLSECEVVKFAAGSAYTAGNVVQVGETPMIIAFTVGSGGTAVGITKAPRVLFPTSTASSAGTANYTLGNAVYWDTAGAGIIAGTNGTSLGFACGVALEAKANTASAVMIAFDAMNQVARLTPRA